MRWSRTITPALITALFALLALGMPVAQALLAAALAFLVAVTLQLPWEGADEPFPTPPTPQRSRGARREAFWLALDLPVGKDTVSDRLVHQLQASATRRLARLGLSLHEPGDADQLLTLLGADAYELLRDPRPRAAPVSKFTAALQVVEELPARLPAHPAETRST